MYIYFEKAKGSQAFFSSLKAVFMNFEKSTVCTKITTRYISVFSACDLSSRLS